MRSRQFSPNVVETVMSGYITRDAVDGRRAEFLAAIGTMRAPVWLFDLCELSGFEPGAVSAGIHWWRAFKEAGGDRVILATVIAPARMAASAIGFSVGLKITATPTREGALKLLQPTATLVSR